MVSLRFVHLGDRNIGAAAERVEDAMADLLKGRNC